MYKILAFYLLLIFALNAESLNIGCASSAIESKKGCSQSSLFQDRLSTFNNLEKNRAVNSIRKVKITKDLDAIKFIYQKKEFLIERIADEDKSCPPHCIQSMNIAGVKTVGELETLKFISSLQHKKNRILVDARSIAEYKKSSIPGAVNIPYTMLSSRSSHRDEVLSLLGAKRLQKKWYFRNIQKLLIFDNGILDNQATKIIKSLLEVGYPEEHILYYRGGVESWKNLGLTLL
ncbi:hypothetical protein MNB_SV-12-1431 [hydrothermal vent metagenome]|uniref:Rhodanese domain-containing protein n=1 Tax=hydrothermal vent metagenome TaxID=652676 RepID=A0A1W1CEJ0_9ZZZZ